MHTTSLALPTASLFGDNDQTESKDASTALRVGTSGQFIRMATEGNLVPARHLWARRSEVHTQLERMQRDLDRINNEDWLFRFSQVCERRRVSFEDTLRVRATRLEGRKAKLMVEFGNIQTQLRHVMPSRTGEPATVMARRLSPDLAAKLADPDSHPTLTINETQQLFAMKSRSTLYRWIDEGKLERASLGKKAGERTSCLVLTRSVIRALKGCSN